LQSEITNYKRSRENVEKEYKSRIDELLSKNKVLLDDLSNSRKTAEKL
jgi:hypothetical protein